MYKNIVSTPYSESINNRREPLFSSMYIMTAVSAYGLEHYQTLLAKLEDDEQRRKTERGDSHFLSLYEDCMTQMHVQLSLASHSSSHLTTSPPRWLTAL